MTENISIHIEHKEIVLERIKKNKISPERMLDWDEVSDISILDFDNKVNE